MSLAAPLRLIITGTDTGIGKTTVSRGLLRALKHRAIRVQPLKWVETGCARREGNKIEGADALALAQAAEAENADNVVGPIRFKLAAAPTVAARAENRDLTEHDLRAAIDASLRMNPQILLIEGAGGALVPLTRSLLFADACRQIALATHFVLVTRDGLGTIHQTLATHEALVRRGARVLAVIANQRTRAEATDSSSSIDELGRWLGDTALLGPVAPLQGSPTDDDLAEIIEATGLVDLVVSALTPA